MSDHWRDHNVFVTGATGFLGGWLVNELLSRQANVTCLVRDWTPRESPLSCNGARIVYGDVCNQSLLERALGEYEIDTVFHLAAQTQVETANNNPIGTFETNIKGTWVLLEACRRSPRVKSIVVASSDKAYGNLGFLAYIEEAPLMGKHPYDVSKSCADLIAQTYAASYNLPVVIARCANLYGGGDLNWNRLIPGTIRSVLRGQNPVIRSDGKYARDYLYVKDAVAAYVRLAERTGISNGEAFNFSSTAALVYEVVKAVLAMMDSPLKPEILGQATNEIHYQHLDSQKAFTRLNWIPIYSLIAGLEETIDWYKKYFIGKET